MQDEKWRKQVAGEFEIQREFSVHLLDAGVVNEAGIGAGASDDELGPEQLGRHLHLVVVYESCCSLQRQGGGRLRREKMRQRGRKEVEDKYKNVRGSVRGRVRVRGKKKEHEDEKKKSCQIS